MGKEFIYSDADDVIIEILSCRKEMLLPCNLESPFAQLADSNPDAIAKFMISAFEYHNQREVIVYSNEMKNSPLWGCLETFKVFDDENTEHYIIKALRDRMSGSYGQYKKNCNNSGAKPTTKEEYILTTKYAKYVELLSDS